VDVDSVASEVIRLWRTAISRSRRIAPSEHSDIDVVGLCAGVDSVEHRKEQDIDLVLARLQSVPADTGAALIALTGA
jgi:hypothetical protein